jgi:hypothetical protein
MAGGGGYLYAPGNHWGTVAIMRMTRVWIGTVGLATLLAGLAGCSTLQQGANKASAADAAAHPNAKVAGRGGVWVQVTPNNISPGFSVQIRASCSDNTNSATVSSPAFGTVTVLPSNSVLFAEVTIPASTKPGHFDVTVTCRTGSTATTSLTIVVANATMTPTPTQASRGPNTGGGYLARHGGAGTGPPGWSTLTSGPLSWFGVALFALLAAAAIGFRARQMSRAPVRARASQPVPVEREERETTH